MSSMWFESWQSVARIGLVGTSAYVALIFVLRISGNRTLSKMNSFDFIVTVALGSCLATGILQKSVPLANIIAALTLLVLLQYAITWITVRRPEFEKLIKSEPILVFRHGEILEQALKRARLTRAEIEAGAREAGLAKLTDAEEIILENNGQLSIRRKRDARSADES